MAGILKTLLGAAEIAAGIVIEVISAGANPYGYMLIAAGAGQVISGIGTMLADKPIDGFATATRNSIAPWRVCYGECAVGGDVVYLHTWGDNDQILDMVVVLASHPCEAVTEVLFEQKRLQLDTNAIPTSALAGWSCGVPSAGSGTSFSPLGQTVDMTSIVRDANGVVTVTLPKNIPYLTAGDLIAIVNVTADSTLNGTFQVAQIVSQTFGTPGAITFTYLCGGTPANVTSQGQARTAINDHMVSWADYGHNVYVEFLLGDQLLGKTFVGMSAGTPALWDGGDGKLVTPASPHSAGSGKDGPQPNPWTNYCSLQGKTAAFIRMRYDKNKFPSGLPQISFRLKGKKDVYDPRTDSYGYTNNAALCIADLLNHGDPTDGRNRTPYGFKAAYGTEIPTDALATAANICDEPVALVKGGTESRYTTNGSFTLDMKRGEILQNLLTSCGGRLTYFNGQFVIQPAQWSTPIVTTVDLQAIAAGPMRWKPTVSVRDLFNGCKGTYISKDNRFQSTDLPPYCQDTDHGYDPLGEYSQYSGDINLAADGGDRRWLEISLPFTTSSATAQRLAKIELLRRRNQGTGTFICNMSAYQYVPLDVIKANASFLGWTNKQLEVSAVRLRTDGNDNNAFALACELDLQETDSSIYEWSVDEELTPQGYQAGHFPGGIVKEDFPFPWSPAYAKALEGDAISGPATFGVQPVYGADAQGNATASLQIIGNAPVNVLADIVGPLVSSQGSDSGGSLKAGSYVVAVCAADSGADVHGQSDYHNFGTASINSDGGSITVSLQWGPGDDGGDLYLAQWTPDENCYVFHWQQAVSPDASSVTVTSFDQTTPGGPDLAFDHFGITWQQVLHAGCFAAQVQAVTSNTVTLAVPLPPDHVRMRDDQWNGYVLSLLAKNDPTVEAPVLNLPVASSTESDLDTGLFVCTIGPNSAGEQIADLTTLLEVADLMIMRTKATFTDTSFEDGNIANGYYPNGATGIEAGHAAVVLTGPDAGDVQTIANVAADSNGCFTIFNLAGQWKTTPNDGDIVIVCSPAMVPEVYSSKLSVKSNTESTVVAQPDVQNLGGRVWLFRVRTEDANGNHCSDLYAPVRDVFLYGSQGTRFVAADTTILPTDSLLDCDATDGPIVITCIPFSQTPNQVFYVVKVDTSANTVTVQVAPDSGDQFDDLSTSVLLSNAGDAVQWKCHG